MKREDCKEGVRVRLQYCASIVPKPSDYGTIVSVEGSIWSEEHDDLVWMQWDSDGSVSRAQFCYLTLEQKSELEEQQEGLKGDSNITEEQAVMLLLSKGYVVFKPN